VLKIIGKITMVFLLCDMATPAFAQRSVLIKATEFKGGGLNPYYANYFERYDLNAVYASPTEEKSVLTANF